MAGRKWTEEETAFVEQYYGTLPIERIAHRTNRTVSAVHNQAGKMHLGRQRPGDVFSMNEFMELLGMDSHGSVRRWISEGLLKAERKHAYGRKYTRPEWWIRERDIITFLRDHGEQVPDAGKVQMPYRQLIGTRWITFVEAFKRGAAYPFFLENAAKAGLLPEARKRGGTGTMWVIPETSLEALVAARRRMTPDQDHRKLVLAYERAQRRGNVKAKLLYMNKFARSVAS